MKEFLYYWGFGMAYGVIIVLGIIGFIYANMMLFGQPS